MTAAHVLEKAKGETAVLVYRKASPDGSLARAAAKLRIREGGNPRWQRHPTADVAAMPVTAPEGAGAFELSRVADADVFDEKKLRVAQDVWIPCYPAGTEGNEAGWPVLRHGTVATHPLRPAKGLKKFFVDFSTFGGDSGAPVLARVGPAGEAKPTVVGLVLAMQRQTDRVKMPFEERVMHTPLGLCVVAPATLLREIIRETE